MSMQRGRWFHSPDWDEQQEQHDPDGSTLAVDEFMARTMKEPEGPQFVQPKRETPTGWIGAQEWNRIVPAARCKECGNVTWKLSLSGGPQKLVDTKKHGPVHADGCGRPNGKLDIKHGLLND